MAHDNSARLGGGWCCDIPYRDAARWSAVAFGVVGLVTSLMGCSVLRVPVEGASKPLAPVGLAGSLDVHFLKLNQDIPGFAGMYWSGERELTVHLLDPERSDGVTGKTLDFVRGLYRTSGDPASDVRVVLRKAPTPLTWAQIEEYKTSLRDVLNIRGVTLIDADERCGCVTIGVESNDVVPTVQEFARTVGVPTQYVNVVITRPFVFLQSLQDSFRPVLGGVRVKNNVGPFAWLGFAGICTMSLVAQRSGTLGFLTNSHCSAVTGGVDGTSFFQNGRAWFNADFVGTEAIDPPWTVTSGCSTGRGCRFSDAAFVDMTASAMTVRFSEIARPSSLCLTVMTCPVAMASGGAYLTVTGTGNSPLLGTVVTKVGQTTGWTGGAVTFTCVNTPVSGTTFEALCTTIVAARSDFGDSGSPVVELAPGQGASATTATLVGILWGGDGTSPSATFAFSPIGAVLAELAGVTIAATPAKPPTKPPPSACEQECGTILKGCHAASSSGTIAGLGGRQCNDIYQACLALC